MKWLHLIPGLVLGVGAYYVLSIASAFWTSRFEPGYLGAAMLLSVIVAAALGFAASLQVRMSAVAAGVMLILVVLGFLLGSSLYDLVPPWPTDISTLFLHGGRSPLVLGATVFTGAASAARIIADSRRVQHRSPDLPQEALRH